VLEARHLPGWRRSGLGGNRLVHPRRRCRAPGSPVREERPRSRSPFPRSPCTCRRAGA